MGFKHQSINWGTPIGARGGMTRDATGYGYRTIRYACHVIAKDLVEYNSQNHFDSSNDNLGINCFLTDQTTA